MIERPQLDLLLRHYDLSRRERIEGLRDEREILQNQHIANGLGNLMNSLSQMTLILDDPIAGLGSAQNYCCAA